MDHRKHEEPVPDTLRDEFVRLPGLFRAWELEHVLVPGTDFHLEKHDQGTGLWLRLQNDEDKAVVVFLGEPHPREVAFVDGKYVEVDEKMKAEGVRASLRIALNVALFDTQEVKVLEQGVVFFKDLVRVREKYGLNKWAFEIQRHGAAKDPKTTYSISNVVDLTAYRPHTTGPVRCAHCGHEFTAVVPVGQSFADCPECKASKAYASGHASWPTPTVCGPATAGRRSCSSSPVPAANGSCA